MTASRTFLGVLPRVWAMLLLACAASALGSGIAIHYSNASQDRQQDAYRRDQDRRQAQARRALEAKFNQALRISSRQNSYSINTSVCGFRGFLSGTVSDKRIPAARRAEIAKFLASQVTSPPDFKCATLPKQPPTP